MREMVGIEIGELSFSDCNLQSNLTFFFLCVSSGIFGVMRDSRSDS